MRLSVPDLDAAAAAIDAANALDPNVVPVDGAAVPRALHQGKRAWYWVTRLSDPADPEVLLAARAHHARRWTVARDAYPEGRAGYHRWKRDVRQLSSDVVRELLVPLGVSEETCARIGAMAARSGLGDDPGTQLVEDAACLVFLETQYDELIERIGEEKVADAVRKTLRKMSPAAIAIAGEAVPAGRGLALLQRVAAET